MSLNGYPFQVHDCACNPPHNAFYSRRSQSWIIYICKVICVEGCWKQKCILKYLNSFLKVIFRVKLPGSVIACLRASMKFILFILKRLPWMFNGSKFSSGSSLSQSSFDIFINIYFCPDYGIKVNFVLRKYILKFTDYHHHIMIRCIFNVWKQSSAAPSKSTLGIIRRSILLRALQNQVFTWRLLF